MVDDPEPAPRVFIDRRHSTTKPWLTISKIGEALIVGAAVISLLFQPITWVTGGLKPQSQIDLADAVKTNALLSARLDALTATEAANKAQALTAVDNVKQLFAARLDAMWRPSDFADRDAHLSKLDTVLEGLRDKTTDNGYAIKDLQQKYQALTTIPTPGPSRGGR